MIYLQIYKVVVMIRLRDRAPSLFPYKVPSVMRELIAKTALWLYHENLITQF